MHNRSLSFVFQRGWSTFKKPIILNQSQDSCVTVASAATLTRPLILKLETVTEATEKHSLAPRSPRSHDDKPVMSKPVCERTVVAKTTEGSRWLVRQPVEVQVVLDLVRKLWIYVERFQCGRSLCHCHISQRRLASLHLWITLKYLCSSLTDCQEIS